MRPKAENNNAWVERATACFITRHDDHPHGARADRQDRMKVGQGKRWLKKSGFYTGLLPAWEEVFG